MKKWGECIKRALRTFAEAAAAYLAAHLVYAVSTGGEDIHVLRTALMGLAVSSVAAGLAAVLNMPKKAESALHIRTFRLQTSLKEKVKKVFYRFAKIPAQIFCLIP